jgi:mRNA interferase RelE/StbE
MAQVVWSPAAERELGKLDPPVAARLLDAVERFAETGHGDVKTLVGEKGVKRLRVGSYRVRFQAEGDTLTVLAVDHRREAYR